MSPLFIPKGGDSVNIPPAKVGAHHAVCCEVADLGIQDTKFGRKHQVTLVWQVAERIEGTGTDYDGKRKEVRRRYNFTLGKDSNLRNDLESWRAEPLTDDDFEDGRFDLMKVEGVQATIIIAEWSEPNENGRQYANLGSVLPADVESVNWNGTTNDLEPEDYVPLAERQKSDEAPTPAATNTGKSSGKGNKKPAPF